MQLWLSYVCTTVVEYANCRVLRADQRAKARSALGVTRKSGTVSNGVVDDDMVYFWQCQSPSRTGEMKGCSFFKILDMRGEGRGPCWGDERVEGGDAHLGAAEEAAMDAEAVRVGLPNEA